MTTWIKTHLRTPLYLNGYLLIAMRAVSTLFGFSFWALAARMMHADEVGLASGIISATILLSGLAQLGLGYGIVRHLPHSKNPNRLLNLSIVIASMMGLLLAFLFLVTLDYWSPALLPLQTRGNSLLFIVLVLSWTLSVLLHWVFVATRRAIFSLTRQTSHMIFAVVFFLGLVYIIPDFRTALIAHTLAALFSVVLSFHALPKAQPGYGFSFRVVNRKILSRKTIKNALRSRFANYSLMNYAAKQAQRAPNTLLPLIVINQLGTSEAAYFFVVWTIGTALPGLISAFGDSLFAEGSNDPAKASAYARRAVILTLLLTTALVLVVIVSGRFILLLYGPDYAEHGLWLLYFVTLAAIPSVLLSMFMSFLRIVDRMSAVLALISVWGTLGLLCTYIGIAWQGLLGAGVGWLLSQSLVLLGTLAWWQWQKRSHTHNTVVDQTFAN